VNKKRFPSTRIGDLRKAFGERLQEGVILAPYTSSRIGGPADFLIEIRSAEDLMQTVERCWEMEADFRILGGGSNVLISDKGVRGVILLNHARDVSFLETETGPRVKAESGASLGSVSRRAVERNWTGLEWATTVPGTVGGAIVGNSGAHGEDVAGCLEVAEILQRGKQPEAWPVERFEYGYRDSVLKHYPGEAVILTATFRVGVTRAGLAKEKMEEFISYRQQTQPTGPSWGSMFKNPPGKSAGRLIDSAGMKGLQIGGVRVSAKHANFFVNLGDASASDALRLIKTVQMEVVERFGVKLELEVELFGDWEAEELDDLVPSGKVNRR
jgi:UDP-N-acetylmuramate dehydrogenase